MPIYEYRCENCGHAMETIQKLSEAPLRRCPDCDTDGLVKKVSAAAFRLKGGGWYETDFKSGNQRNVAGEKSEGAGASSSEKGSEKGGEKGSKETAPKSGGTASKGSEKSSTGPTKGD
jgi:putative FmdB family regulatory protein